MDLYSFGSFGGAPLPNLHRFPGKSWVAQDVFPDGEDPVDEEQFPDMEEPHEEDLQEEDVARHHCPFPSTN